jgi:ABC-type phosphate transport system substrate-binding protein
MKIISTCSIATLLLASFYCQAEIAVIVHPSANVESLTDNDVSRLFLGKSKTLPSGTQAIPVNQDEGTPARASFNEKICKKDASQYKAYWSQLVFTGKGTPPKDSGKDTDVKALVAANPNIIGYIDSKLVDTSVKVVLKIPD